MDNIGGFSSMASAALSYAGTLASIEGSKGMQDKELRYNEEQAAINRDWQTQERIAAQEYYTDLFNQANEWNSIGSQIERGRLAGVSPSAIISGKVNGASAQPSMSHVGSGSQASTSSGGAIGSALVGAIPNMLNATGSFVKNMTDSFVARDTLALNKDLIAASIKEKFASTKNLLSNAGLADVKADEVVANLRWLDKLNYAEYREKMGRCTLYYNQCQEILSQIYVNNETVEQNRQRLQQDIKESNARINNLDYVNMELDSRTELNYSQSYVNDEQAQALRIDNETRGAINKATLTQEELKVLESRMRYNLACELGLPLGSSEFEFNYVLWRSGKLENYCDEVVAPLEQSTWKPSDLALPKGFGVVAPNFKARKGLLNQHNLLNGLYNHFGSILNGLDSMLPF